MKKNIFTTVLLFILTMSFAQGIAVQGIARDTENNAITNKDLSFDFRILNSDDAVLFRELQDIKTDNYGLFAHVVSTGTAQDGSIFVNVDFSQPNLTLQVWVKNNGEDIKVYDQEMQYVPYAHFAKKAENGVPPGTVVAFMGVDDKIPNGWVKCDGTDITNKGTEYDALKGVIGNRLPDLRGRFLKGDGKAAEIDVDYIVVGSVGSYQEQAMPKHKHAFSATTSTSGNHRHRIYHSYYGTPNGIDDRNSDREFGEQMLPNGDVRFKLTNYEGNHNHTISGNTNESGEGKETRPWTAIVNYIIKL